MSAMLLILCLLLTPAFSSPIPDQPPSGEDKQSMEQQPELTSTEDSTALDDTVTSTEYAPRGELSKDLTAQETFYPVIGGWWGVRPWGGWGGWGWGGHRPWHGWHGPHWGGHWGGPWGGHWGGHWGGGRWGSSRK